MPSLNVPKKYREGVFRISQLDERTVQEISRALNETFNTQEGLSKAAIASLAVLSETNKKDFIQIAEALVALYSVKSGADVPTEDFAEDIYSAMEQIEEAQWRVAEDHKQRFENNLLQLLSAEAFSLRSKAQDLQTDDERTFCRARILTDIRAVFGDRIEDGPKGMVLVHLLKMGFHQSGRGHDEFFIALDENDLQTLKRVIERAQLKAKTLRSSVPTLPMLGVGIKE